MLIISIFYVFTMFFYTYRYKAIYLSHTKFISCKCFGFESFEKWNISTFSKELNFFSSFKLFTSFIYQGMDWQAIFQKCHVFL